MFTLSGDTYTAEGNYIVDSILLEEYSALMAKKEKPEDALESLRRAQDCKVVLKDTRGSFIVKTEEGKNINALTPLPEVVVGDEGLVIEHKGIHLFIARPS